MQPHFRAFSFVDRINSAKPGAEITGTYHVPASLSAFPSSLVAEAVGQLAAWLAMATLDFRSRPVAGIASKVELLAAVQPGHTLGLSAVLESVEEDAVAYDGTAAVDGVPVVRLRHCVGPMVALEDFDDPGVVRGRFHLLQAQGAEPGGFAGVPSIPLERGPGEAGQRKTGTLLVPATADFFGDHFPRRPVFPGSLLMHSNLELVADLAAELPPADSEGAWQLHEIQDMKLRAFIPPGEPIHIEATLDQCAGQTASISVQCRNSRRITGSAQVVLAWKLPS